MTAKPASQVARRVSFSRSVCPCAGLLQCREPRVDGPNPNSRAADPQTTAITAGTSITYYGDVHVGTIAERVGNPHDTDPWEWSCGFYPGSHPGEHQSDTTATFEEARADFEHAWQVFLSNRTEADFQAWRDQRDWTERRYADAGKRLEPSSHGPGTPCSRFMKCPCGAVFDLHRPAAVLMHVPTTRARPNARKRELTENKGACLLGIGKSS